MSHLTYDVFVAGLPAATISVADKLLREMFDQFGTIVSTESRPDNRDDGALVSFVRFTFAICRHRIHLRLWTDENQVRICVEKFVTM